MEFDWIYLDGDYKNRRATKPRKPKTRNPCGRCGSKVPRDGICKDCCKGAVRYGPCCFCRARNVLLNRKNGIDCCADCWENPVVIEQKPAKRRKKPKTLETLKARTQRVTNIERVV